MIQNDIGIGSWKLLEILVLVHITRSIAKEHPKGGQGHLQFSQFLQFFFFFHDP
jgi:hypothetical protein